MNLACSSWKSPNPVSKYIWTSWKGFKFLVRKTFDSHIPEKSSKTPWRERLLSWQLSRHTVTPCPRKLSHRRSLLKGPAVRSAPSKHIQGKFTGRKKCGRKKVHKPQGWPRPWEDCRTKPIQELGGGALHKEATEAGVGTSTATRVTSVASRMSSRSWSRGDITSILPGLRRKTTASLLSGPKFSFQMKVAFAFHLEIKVSQSGVRVERHSIQAVWSPAWRFHSHWWFGVLCCLLVLVHCALSSPESQQPSTGGNVHASVCWRALWRC